ncbi:MAG: heme ABC transporter ATP-binding protein [Vicinamibacterales bacterium]
MLQAKDVVFRVDGRALVDRVTVTFEPGRLHLLIGANGAGKSTLVRLLSRLLRPTDGRVTYGEADAAQWSERELAKRRAVLSQAIEVAFPIPVRELVMMGRYPHFRGSPGPIDDQICDEVMRFFDVTEMADRSYGTLSGGERQRVNFARVLAQIWQPLDGSARYLFLDEPLTFLDIRHQLDFMRKVKAFAASEDVVVVGVVHDLNLAAKFADRLLLLHQGGVLADGPTADVLTADNLRAAFQVRPIVLTDPETGAAHLAFD